MINDWLFTSNTDLWETPIELFNDLDREFHFTLDPCATSENPVILLNINQEHYH